MGSPLQPFGKPEQVDQGHTPMKADIHHQNGCFWPWSARGQNISTLLAALYQAACFQAATISSSSSHLIMASVFFADVVFMKLASFPSSHPAFVRNVSLKTQESLFQLRTASCSYDIFLSPNRYSKKIFAKIWSCMCKEYAVYSSSFMQRTPSWASLAE